MPPTDMAQFLADSPDRVRLLGYLDETPDSPGNVADALSIPRRSVQRNLAEFVDRGWAEKRRGDYHLTTTGALVTDQHTAYLDRLDVVETFGTFFRHLPDRAHAPSPEWMADAELTVATTDDPQAPVHQYVTRLRTFESDRIRMLSPVLSRLFHDAHADLALRGVHTELVMSDAMIERARERNPAEFAVVVSVGVLDLYRHPSAIDVGLTIGDERLLMGAYDDDGHLQACVESTDIDFLAWAGELFERYRARSERVEPNFSFPFDAWKSKRG
ncbi:MAG: helix-turn-helix transcriptional regulator [Halobacteriota archaeon]